MRNRQFGARLLNRLRFRTKLMLLPIVAAVGFLVVLLVSTVLRRAQPGVAGTRGVRLLPAVETSEQLNHELTSISAGCRTPWPPRIPRRWRKSTSCATTFVRARSRR